MNPLSLIRRKRKFDPGSPRIITFTGGMGAQMISAGAYFSMRDSGQPVLADLSYFDRPEKVAKAGHPGDCSHWAWQLNPFGILPDAFACSTGHAHDDPNVLHDGSEKLELGLIGLAQASVKARFVVPGVQTCLLPSSFDRAYLCIHIRRGDYVNVASHLISDGSFVSLAKRFQGLVGSLAVVSDSPIGSGLRSALSNIFEETVFLDSIDPFSSHLIMRRSRILVCSNSQFSLVAAALNEGALIVIPKQWFGSDQKHIEFPLQSRCEFQLLNN